VGLEVAAGFASLLSSGPLFATVTDSLGLTHENTKGSDIGDECEDTLIVFSSAVAPKYGGRLLL